MDVNLVDAKWILVFGTKFGGTFLPREAEGSDGRQRLNNSGCGGQFPSARSSSICKFWMWITFELARGLGNLCGQWLLDDEACLANAAYESIAGPMVVAT